MAENKDKLVVVTGGTKGIGRAIVEKFAGQGYAVATCSRNKNDLEELQQAVLSQTKNEVLIHQADVSTKEGVGSLVAFVLSVGKPVEVLVNNTGRFIPGTIHEEEEGVLEEQIETNLYSAYRMSRGLIPDMKKRTSGHIFNMCSIASITAYATGGSYSISKFAMYGMSKGLREELKEFGVRVTAVMPGATLTASWEGVDIPEERFMKSEDVAELVYTTYTLSDRTVVEDLVIRPQLGDL